MRLNSKIYLALFRDQTHREYFLKIRIRSLRAHLLNNMTTVFDGEHKQQQNEDMQLATLAMSQTADNYATRAMATQKANMGNVDKQEKNGKKDNGSDKDKKHPVKKDHKGQKEKKEEK